ncbi:MAG: rod shape-determining protein MreD [Anaerolineaceae bacterium]|nr:MAG: rod shape-determining protein MreD [Anaerolineaceae bacterium]
MVYLIGVPLLLILAIFQSSVFSHLALLDGRPDLVLLAVLSWSLAGRHNEAMLLGLIGGLFLDLFSGLPFGSHAIILVFVIYFAASFEGRFWEAHLLLPLSVSLIASLLFHGLEIGTILIMGRSFDFTYVLTRVVLPSTFLNLVLVLPASQFAEGLRARLYPPEVEI